MYIKKLVGKKCFLAPIDPADAEKYAAWLNDQELLQFLQMASLSISVEAEREALARLSREHAYAIVELETGELLGNVGLMNLSHLHGTAEIGIFIGDKDRWGRGYGAEALSLLLDYGFRTLNLNAVMLRTYPFNPRAVACYEKIGFKQVGRLRQALRRDRAYHDLILMDILAEDFYAGRP